MRILIIKMSSLGDIIHTLPCLYALKKGMPDVLSSPTSASSPAEISHPADKTNHYARKIEIPDIKIDWLVERENAEILQGHPYINHLIVLPRKTWMKRPWYIGRILCEAQDFLSELRSHEYDLIIDFQGLLRSGILVGLGKGKRKIGFNRVREMAHLFYTEKVPLSALNQHAVLRYLEIPGYLGIKEETPNFFLPLNQKAYKEAEKVWNELGLPNTTTHKIIFVNPNARWQSKQWPVDYFRELIQKLSFNNNEIIVIGGPDEREKIREEFAGLGENVHSIAGMTSLMGLAAIFEKGDCLITNDSGPMHLAVAVGMPVVALFGPSNPVRTGPFGWEKEDSLIKVIQSREPCSPCYKKICTHKRCMRGISIDQVLSAINEKVLPMPFHA